MYVKLEGRQVSEVKLRLYEPPRFFEAFLRGRSFTEMPDLTGARDRRAGTADEEGRKRADDSGRRPRGASDQRARGRLLPGADPAELRALIDPLERARDTALATVRWTSTLEFPDVQLEPEHVALADPVGYPIDRGRIVSDRGSTSSPQVPRSVHLVLDPLPRAHGRP